MKLQQTILDALLPRELGAPERLARDLQRLLNTRCHYPYLDGSVFSDGLPGYGLPAAAVALSSRGDDGLGVLCQVIEYKIRAFEPRFRSVKVTVDQGVPPSILLRIEATLMPPPAPIFVAAARLWPDGQFDVHREMAS